MFFSVFICDEIFVFIFKIITILNKYMYILYSMHNIHMPHIIINKVYEKSL